MLTFINYLDIKRATIAILKDYHNQQFKMENSKRTLKNIDNRLFGKTSNLDTEIVSGSRNNNTEDQWIAGIDRKMAEEYGYTQACNFINEFNIIWDQLTDEEQEILKMRYIEKDEGNGIEAIIEEYHICKSEAYSRSSLALEKFSKLLFW